MRRIMCTCFHIVPILVLCSAEICRFEFSKYVGSQHGSCTSPSHLEGLDKCGLDDSVEFSFVPGRHRLRIPKQQLLRIRGGEPHTPLPQTPNSAIKRSRRLLGQSPEYKKMSPTMSARKKKTPVPVTPRKLADESDNTPQTPAGHPQSSAFGKLVISPKAFDRIKASLEKGKRASVRQGGRSRMGVVLQNGSPYTLDGRLVVRGQEDDSSSVSELPSSNSVAEREGPLAAQPSFTDSKASQAKSIRLEQPRAAVEVSGHKSPGAKRLQDPEHSSIPGNISMQGSASANAKSRKRGASQSPNKEIGLSSSSPYIGKKKAKSAENKAQNPVSPQPSGPHPSQSPATAGKKQAVNASKVSAMSPRRGKPPASRAAGSKINQSLPASSAGDPGSKVLEDADGATSLTGKKDLLITGTPAPDPSPAATSASASGGRTHPPLAVHPRHARPPKPVPA